MVSTRPYLALSFMGIIGKKSFLGASPGPCPDSARFTSGEYDKSKVGPPPDKAEIVAWIESLGG